MEHIPYKGLCWPTNLEKVLNECFLFPETLRLRYSVTFKEDIYITCVQTHLSMGLFLSGTTVFNNIRDIYLDCGTWREFFFKALIPVVKVSVLILRV